MSVDRTIGPLVFSFVSLGSELVRIIVLHVFNKKIHHLIRLLSINPKKKRSIHILICIVMMSLLFCVCRYNGREGYVPATYLMKSEAFSMKKPKVTRASVGGPEIVKNLHDISDLLKVCIRPLHIGALSQCWGTRDC